MKKIWVARIGNSDTIVKSQELADAISEKHVLAVWQIVEISEKDFDSLPADANFQKTK